MRSCQFYFQCQTASSFSVPNKSKLFFLQNNTGTRDQNHEYEDDYDNGGEGYDQGDKDYGNYDDEDYGSKGPHWTLMISTMIMTFGDQ